MHNSYMYCRLPDIGPTIIKYTEFWLFPSTNIGDDLSVPNEHRDPQNYRYDTYSGHFGLFTFQSS